MLFRLINKCQVQLGTCNSKVFIVDSKIKTNVYGVVAYTVTLIIHININNEYSSFLTATVLLK